MEKVRDVRLDTLKGLLILLVVYGHFFTHDATHDVISESLANFIYSFHMPLFVFISGYLSHNRRFGQSIIRLMETYAVFQLIKGLWLHYSIKWLLVMPGPMLWYLFALIIWRAIYAVFCKMGVRITWHWIFLFVALSVGAGLIPSIGRMFALSRIIFFAPYFFLGVLFQKNSFIDEIKKRMDARVSIIILFLALFVSWLCAIHNINVREVFGGTEPYQVNNWEIYLIARIACYVTSIIVSLSFIRVISFKLNVLGTIGKDTLKYYMFHGLFLLAIEAVNAPWSSLFSILYATIVSIAIYFFNKTQLSNFAINPISYIISRIHSGQNNIEKNG